MAETSFRPDINGFAFINAWQFDDTEKAEIRTLFADAISVTGILQMLIPSSPLGLFNFGAIQKSLTAWSQQAVVETYGLCGGMAFAALDYYYQAGAHFPRGMGANDQPTRNTPEGKLLRDYLWRRLIDSLAANIPTFLMWMAFLHRVPEGFLFGGGPPWLSRQSLKQWQTLKNSIDAGKPWPIGLVGTTTDPTQNHQVVAYGYDDPGDGTGVLHLYDMNCPGQEQTTRITFGDRMLEAVESCGGSRGPLRGFFCEQYVPDPNPPAIQWP